MPIVTVSCGTCGIQMPESEAAFNIGDQEYYCKFHNAAIEIYQLEAVIAVREKNIKDANAHIEMFKNQIEHFRKIQEENPLQNVEQI